MGLFRNPVALVILLVLVILLFGAGKLPGLAKNLGQSMRIFKSEVDEMTNRDGNDRRGEDHEGADHRDEGSHAVDREDRRRDDRYADDRRRDDRYDEDRRSTREYDPRDDREPVRSTEDEDRYRRG